MTGFSPSVGAAFLAFLAATGRLALFAGRRCRRGFAPPFYPRLILRQMVEIGYFSLPVVGLTAIFTGMVLALQIYTGFSRFNAESAIATVVVLSMTRELGPVLAGLMVAGRVGAAMAAEIGTMRVTEQIDALTTLSTDPLQLSGAAAPDRRRSSPCRSWCWSPTSSACSAAISSASTSSTSTRSAYLTNTARLPADDGRRLRPGQGRGVRLHRSR